MQLEEKLTQLRDKKIDLQQLAQQKTDLQKQIDAITAEILEAYEARNIKSMKIKGVGNFVTYQSSYPKVTNHVLLQEWMVSNDFEYNIVTAFNAKKFQGFYRELLDNKQPLPPGCENFVKTSIRIGKE